MTRRTPEQYDWNQLLFDETWLTKHYTPQSSKRLRAVVVHHMASVGNGHGSALDGAYRTWQTRPASAHYGVESNLVRQYVRDKDRAWSVGNRKANSETISIEHANSTGGPSWKVSDTTWRTGAKLAAYLHVRYGLGRPVKNVTLKRHKDFGGTICPGPYMDSIFDQYVGEAQRVYDAIVDAPGAPAPPKPPSLARHYIVRAGDTLTGIARRFGTTVANLTKWNRLPDANKIKVGQDLIVDDDRET